MRKLTQSILGITSIFFLLGGIKLTKYKNKVSPVKHISEIIAKKRSILSNNQNATIHFEIKDKISGRLIPGKVVVMQNGKPADLDRGEQRLVTARKNIIYTINGKGNFKIKPGEYNIWFGRGLEYSVDSKKITLKGGRRYTLTGRIKQEVKTPGYIGTDMHLHTVTWSGHGDATVKERVIASLGEGLDRIVSSDHNRYVTPYPTDYKPIIKKLGIDSQLSAAAGTEISTPDMGHFNVYPLDPQKKFPVNNDFNNAKKLFHQIRKSVGDSVVIQVNHPYWPGLDYFRKKGLNHHPGTSNGSTWSWDFDSVELLNGHSRYDNWEKGPKNPIVAKYAWFNMLNNGRRITGVGNSDSHTVGKAIVGIPRNYIASSTDNPANINGHEIITNIKKGKVSVSRGLYIKFNTESGDQIGSTVKPDKEGSITFHIKVQAAKWIDCDNVKIIKNGHVFKKFEVSKSNEVVRFNKVIADKPEKDSWYLVVAKGSEPMEPMYKENMAPLAFTNPIWVEAKENHK